MLTKRYSLGIVQTHATQFDGPLFSYLSRNPGIDLTIYYTKPYGEQTFDKEIERSPGWDNAVTTGYRYKTRKSGFLSAVKMMTNIASSRHDLIIISGYMPIYHFAIAVYARLKGLAVGLRSDTTLLYKSAHSLRSLFKGLIIPRLLKLYWSCHQTGTLAKQYLLQYNFAENRIFHFPYAVDNNYLATRCSRYRKRRSRIRRALGIDHNSFVVLGIVKFIEREDPMTLLMGFARLLEKYSTAHLLLVGDGAMMENIKAVIKKNKISNVHLPGFIRYSRLPLFYGVADVFVHPAVHECWGVSVNEAMACGLPVIVAHTVGSHIDLVKPGQTGFVFEARNPEELASYLIKLSGDIGLRESMGRNAEKLIADWGYECIEKSLLEALTVVAKKS